VTGGFGLDAGVYHYDPRLHVLDRLRSGDFRAQLVDATGGEPNAADAGSFLALTTTYWRNAWKYRARAYRHAFWDSGTMLANLFDMGAAGGIPMHLLLGFADEEVHRLLDVDAEKESAVALVAIADARRQAAEPAPSTPEPQELETTPLSATQVDYPEIREVQRASSLGSGTDAREWRESGPIETTRHRGTDTTLRHLDAPAPELNLVELEGVIRKRGSWRIRRRIHRLSAPLESRPLHPGSERGLAPGGDDALRSLRDRAQRERSAPGRLCFPSPGKGPRASPGRRFSPERPVP
jgi:SagB-type dehydrogenase family enzyme